MDWTTRAMHCTSRMPNCPMICTAMTPTSAPVSVSPVGAMMLGTSPPKRLKGIEMICATMLNATEMITTTPRVDQKRPRVRRHDRPIARNTGDRSRMMTDGTKNSFAASQRDTTISPSTARTPSRMPSHSTDMTSRATIAPSAPRATTVAASKSAL